MMQYNAILKLKTNAGELHFLNEVEIPPPQVRLQVDCSLHEDHPPLTSWCKLLFSHLPDLHHFITR